MLFALLMMIGVSEEVRPRDPLATITDPADRAVMTEAAAALAVQPPDLKQLDPILAKLPRPTPLRAMVQTARAWALANAERRGEAVAAIEEAIRLAPDNPLAKLTAAHILTFTGATRRAADLLLEVSRSDPRYAVGIDRYVLGALVGRLRETGDRDRADRVEARMAEIGYAAALAPERSSNALSKLRAHLTAGEREAAEGAIGTIGDPEHLAALMVDRRYEAMWPRLEEWGGPGLHEQSRRHLEELRREWDGSGGFDTATNYARRLASMRQFNAVSALFAPMYDKPGLSADVDGIELLAPSVARSLAALGRRAEAERLLERVAALMPPDGSGRDLNVLAAKMMLDVAEQRWAEVMPRADLFMASAKAVGPSVNDGAVRQVRAFRACALQGLGRTDEARTELAQLLLAQAAQPSVAWTMLGCVGDVAAGRDFLVARLADERTRDWALRIVQPGSAATGLAQDRATHAFREKVRRNPAVLAAVAKVGRVLDRAVADELPAGFDPFAAGPGARARPGEV